MNYRGHEKTKIATAQLGPTVPRGRYSPKQWMPVDYKKYAGIYYNVQE